MCGDSGIDSIIITNPARLARQNRLIGIDMAAESAIIADLTDRFPLPQAPEDEAQQDRIQSERMLCLVLRLILCAGFALWIFAMAGLIANGNAIPSLKGVSYATQGK